MRKDTKLLYLSLFLMLMLPLGALSILALKVAQDEELMYSAQRSQTMTLELERLRDFGKYFIEQYAVSLERKTRQVKLNAGSIREYLRTWPEVTQMLVLNSKGGVLHPPVDAAKSSAEEKFLKKTAVLLRRGDFIWQSNDSEESSLWPRTVGGKFSKPENSLSVTRWVPFFQDEGVNFFLVIRLGEKFVVLDVNRTRVISDFLNALPPVTAGRKLIRLVDSRGIVLHQWGSLPAGGETLSSDMEMNMAPPFGSWKLEYRLAETAGRFSGLTSTRLNVLAATGLVLVLSLIAAAYFVRRYRFHLKEAESRVSFVNRVSHELKTPLTNIRMYADLLEDGLSDDEDSALGGYAGVISQESLRLSRMISNVLNFARHERGSLTLNRGEWSVDEIVGEVVEQFKEALCEKRISVKVNAAQSQMVEVDRDVLLQILYNLLSNAEKYLPAGSSIFIEHAQILSDTVVKVIDDGPGIPEELRDAVFEPFYRVSDSMNEGVSGTGLGLAISRELARLHGGDLTLEDSKKGAIFFLTINAPLVHDEQDGEIVE